MTQDELRANVRALYAVVKSEEELVDGLTVITQAYVDGLRAKDAGVRAPPISFDALFKLEQGTIVMIACPERSGDGFDSRGDRHARTAKDVCPTCHGHMRIPANTGTSLETSAPAAVPDAAEADAEAKRYRK